MVWFTTLLMLLQAPPDEIDLPLIDPLAVREEWAQRDVWQGPSQVIAALVLRDGQVVADLGAGKGYFTYRLARAERFTNRYEVRREAEAAAFVLEKEHDLSSQFFLVFAPGRASIFDVVPGFHYVSSEIAIGTGAPDSSAVRLLQARGFLTLVDVRRGGDVLPLRASDMGYVRIRPGDHDFTHALCEQIDDPETGVVYIFAEHVGAVAEHLITATRARLLSLTEYEERSLRAVLDE